MATGGWGFCSSIWLTVATLWSTSLTVIPAASGFQALLLLLLLSFVQSGCVYSSTLLTAGCGLMRTIRVFTHGNSSKITGLLWPISGGHDECNHFSPCWFVSAAAFVSFCDVRNLIVGRVYTAWWFFWVQCERGASKKWLRFKHCPRIWVSVPHRVHHHTRKHTHTGPVLYWELILNHFWQNVFTFRRFSVG